MYFEIANVTVSPVVLILWAMFTGFVFSTVGAAGGILAGMGHITIYGIKNANMIKPMNQILTTITPIISTPLYMRERRLLLPVAIGLGAGGIMGALAGSYLSHTYLSDMQNYKMFFGILTYVIAARLWYEITPRFREKQKKVKEATKNFENKVKELRASGKMNELKEIGVKYTKLGLGRNEFSFGGEKFTYQAWMPFLAGFLVAVISASMGVGGGFLLVPFLASLMGFPMFVVAGTVTLSILITSATSVLNYISMGSVIDYALLSWQIVGIAIGSYIGVMSSKFIKAVYLKGGLALILTYIGTSYVFGPIIFELTGFKM
ncbi:sulfite exporter TauE/SafE family protein [Desulfofalx alkaliphila]|uniref:sulfite exporter TauE/SafE family protein n=1 Tax=Desulfofalx alkaliphila TaxID=105483 RepID=UPI0004E0C921|nr:sulfite exporter TauE/SafE family protein [Desulfofalx alkaliphila]